MFLAACSTASIINAPVTSLIVGQACQNNTVLFASTALPKNSSSVCALANISTDTEVELRVIISAKKTDHWRNMVVFDRTSTVSPDQNTLITHIPHKTGWPNGSYEVRIEDANGALIAQEDFSIGLQ